MIKDVALTYFVIIRFLILNFVIQHTQKKARSISQFAASRGVTFAGPNFVYLQKCFH